MDRNANTYITAKYLTVSQFQGKYVIGSGSKQKIISNYNLFSDIVKIADFCLSKRNKNDVINYVSQNNIHIESFNFMVENKYLLHNDINLESRFSRNHIYFENINIDSEKMQKTLSNKHIVIAGCGGIGNALSYIFCTMGVKKLTLIDDDIIEKSNLNRQFMFTEKDIGNQKIYTLKNALMERNSEIEIDTIGEHVSYNVYIKLPDSVDFIILSADDSSSLKSTTQFAVKNKIPYLNVGYLCDYSVIGPFYIPNQSSCLMCSYELLGEDIDEDDLSLKQKIKAINTHMKAPSSTINNFFAASMATIDILHFFNGDYKSINSLNKRIGLSNKDFKFYELAFKPNHNCSLCGLHPE